MATIVDYDDLTRVYNSVRDSNYTKEEVNSYHIIYAEAEINGRLASKYSTPFSSNNNTAKDLVLQLTYSRVAALSEEDRKSLHDQLQERIDRLLSGDELMLTTSGGIAAQPTTSPIWSNTEDYPAATSMDNPLNWEVGSKELYDERDVRDQL